MTSDLFQKHSALLEDARRAIRKRTYWSAYPESPSAKFYGDAARPDAEAALGRLLGQRFEIPDHPVSRWCGAEDSPWGESINISYPAADTTEVASASNAARERWAAASIEARVGVCLEILAKLNQQSYLTALTCRITTGQPFLMAFQSGGPHAQERALEAVAYAYEEMTRVPRTAIWEKPGGKGPPVRVEKHFRLTPRGIGLVIGCATFPTWNSYAGAFASLATGNTLIVKPHPLSILPLAIFVGIAREVLKRAGFDPNVVLLAADTPHAPLTQELALHPDVAIIDFTGGPAFGSWLRTNVRNALLYTEEAGVNSIVIDSTHDLKGMLQSIASSLCLYSGQMCTAPQNIFIARTGVDTDVGHKSFEEIAAAIREAVRSLLSDPARAEAILGCIQSTATLERIRRVTAEGPVLLQSNSPHYPSAPNARAATPIIRRVTVADRELFAEEKFGPISYIVATDSSAESIQVARDLAREKGAITMGVYSMSPHVLEEARRAAAQAGVGLSCNFLGNLLINQNAAFSDYHVSGANPAGTACMTDGAFVASRFRVAASRAAMREQP